jgi:hypothetical protein
MGGQALSRPRESNSILCGSVRASEVDFSVSVSEPQPEPLLVMSKVLRQRAGQGIVGPVAMPTPLLGVGSEKLTGMLPTGQSAASKVRPRGKKSEPKRYVCTEAAHSEISDDLLSGISTTQPPSIFPWTSCNGCSSRLSWYVEVQQSLAGGRENTNTLYHSPLAMPKGGGLSAWPWSYITPSAGSVTWRVPPRPWRPHSAVVAVLSSVCLLAALGLSSTGISMEWS